MPSPLVMALGAGLTSGALVQSPGSAYANAPAAASELTLEVDTEVLGRVQLYASEPAEIRFVAEVVVCLDGASGASVGPSPFNINGSLGKVNKGTTIKPNFAKV